MNSKLAFGYYRLSSEEDGKAGESSSIESQRLIVRNYCTQHGITLVQEFADDGWSGANFDRPQFMEMIRQLEKGKADIVITKDLSRLGRDMLGVGYYVEHFFPEHGIQYIAISENYDSKLENFAIPFYLALNEAYLLDCSRKVRQALESKRKDGQYCACPPYGYKKDPNDKSKLTPDENTAPIVQRIFCQAAAGDSSRKIALDLTADDVMPPQKYRALCRDNFSEKGMATVSDVWNNTTVKRILKNEVYLGVTQLGKSKKASVKSKVKVPIPREEWAETKDTHEPLVSPQIFDLAQKNLGKGSSDYRQYDQVRKSIFGGVAYCAKCGHALCSCGTVYLGEREKYWYLSCINQRKDIANPCDGVRIRYADLMEVVRQDLNGLLRLSDEDVRRMVDSIIALDDDETAEKSRKMKLAHAQNRKAASEEAIARLYIDYSAGDLDKERFERMKEILNHELDTLQVTISELSREYPKSEAKEKYDKFFALARQYEQIETLDRETLLTFVDRIEVSQKELPPTTEKATHRNTPFLQSIHIFYKFVGELPSG